MYVRRDKYQIYYNTYGSGTPIIFIHGLGGNTKQIESLNLFLPGYMIVSIDMQGHGFSGMSDDLTFDSMTEDVIAVANKLKLDKFIIGGISMGAAISLNLALKYQDRIIKMFLIRSAWLDKPLSDENIKFFSKLSNFLKHNMYDEYLRTREITKFQKTNPVFLESILNAFVDSGSLLYPSKYEIVPNLVPFKRLSDLKRINKSILILWCQNDPLHPKEISTRIAKTFFYSIIEEITSPYINRDQYNSDVSDKLAKFL